MGCLGWIIIAIIGLLFVLFGGVYLFSAVTVGLLKLLFSPYTLIAVIVLVGLIVLKTGA